MILTAVFAMLSAFAPADAPVSLSRVFTKGEKFEYEVKASLQDESRQRGLTTWIPVDVDYIYRFVGVVSNIKSDGVAIINYKRPTITEIIDAPGADEEQKRTIKSNWNLLVSISPANEILDVKDLDKKPDKDKDKNSRPVKSMRSYRQAETIDILLQSLTSGLNDILLFMSGIDSDFSPRLPFEEVTTGYSWKRTIGYSPQKLQGKEGKMAVQRMDYTYTYKGIVDSGKIKVHRVHADLVLDTNIADFLLQSMGADKSRSILKSLPFKLNSQIDFDLDLKTRKTLKAVATSEATAQIILTLFDDAYEEKRIKGRTVLRFLPKTP